MKSHRFKKVLTITVALTMTAMAGCSGGNTVEEDPGAASDTTAGSEDSNPEDADPLTIGVVLPVNVAVSDQMRNGMELAVEALNEGGGVLGGRQVELVVEDDEGLPEVGRSAFESLLGREEIVAITGGVHSSVALATVGVTEQAEMLHVVTGAQAPAITEEGHDLLFRLNTTNIMNGEYYHPWILEEFDPQVVAVMAEQSDYGEAELEQLNANWSEDSAPEMAVERFEPDTTDFSGQLTNLGAADPDILYVASALFETNAQIVRQARDSGLDVQYLLAPNLLSSSFVDEAGPAGDGVVSSNIYAPDFDSEVNSAFVSDFEAKFDYTPGTFEVLGWESIWIPVQAMDEVGAAGDSAAVAEAMRSHGWDSPRGTVTFDDTGQAQAGEDLFYQVVRDGQVVLYN